MTDWDFDAPQFYDFNKTNEGSGDEWFDIKEKKLKDVQDQEKKEKRKSFKTPQTLTKAYSKRLSVKSSTTKINKENMDLQRNNEDPHPMVSQDLTKALSTKKRNSMRLQKKATILKSCTNPLTPKFHTNTRLHINHIKSNNNEKENLKPSPVRKALITKMKPKTNDVKRSRVTMSVPFSFQEKDRLIKEKKEKAVKDALDQQQKARTFKANPNPSQQVSKHPRGRMIKPPTEAKPFSFMVEARGRNRLNTKPPPPQPQERPLSKTGSTLLKPPAGKQPDQMNVTSKVGKRVTVCKEFNFATDRLAQKRKLLGNDKNKK